MTCFIDLGAYLNARLNAMLRNAIDKLWKHRMCQMLDHRANLDFQNTSSTHSQTCVYRLFEERRHRSAWWLQGAHWLCLDLRSENSFFNGETVLKYVDDVASLHDWDRMPSKAALLWCCTSPFWWAEGLTAGIPVKFYLGISLTI